jgi:hypothetical protein
VKKVEQRQILIRLRVSRSTSLEMRSRTYGIGILINKDTTSKLTMILVHLGEKVKFFE